MKKRLLWLGSLVLLLSLTSNVYLYLQHNRRHNMTRHYVTLSVGNAARLLHSSATMKIMPNTLNNSYSVRGLQVGQAASDLASVAPFLDQLGVHHVQGIAMILNGYSFPMMFPHKIRHENTAQMLTLVRYSSNQLNACLDNGKLNINKLKTAVNNIYQHMPAQERKSAFNDASP